MLYQTGKYIDLFRASLLQLSLSVMKKGNIILLKDKDIKGLLWKTEHSYEYGHL